MADQTDDRGQAAGGRTEAVHEAGGNAYASVPGWIISVVLHVVLVLIATLFYLERTINQDETAYLTQIRRPDAPKLADVEEPPQKKKKAEAEEEAPEDLSQVVDPGSHEDSNPSAGDEGGDVAASPLGVAGFGDGPGAAYARPSGRKAGGGKKPGGVTDRHLKAALRWLARHQNDDGGWSVTQFHKNCGRNGYADDCARNEYPGNDQYDTGVTALALLAFLGGGYTSTSKEPVYAAGDEPPGGDDLFGESRKLTYGQVVKRACKSLIARQDPAGRLGPDVDRHVYNHMIGTLALSEAYGITRIWLLRGHVEKAVRFLLDARSPGGAWGYGHRSADADTCVTGWAVLALESARASGFEVGESWQADARRWFDQVTVTTTIPDASMGDPAWDENRPFTLAGYRSAKDAGRLVSVSGFNEHYAYTPALAAVSVMASTLIAGKPPAKAAGVLDTLLRFLPPRWSADDKESWKKVDFYFWYHASYALFQLTPADDPRWKRWQEAIKQALMETQNLKRFEGLCAEGSWDPIDRWSCEGGRVYATALAALAIEVYYRFPRVLGLEKKEKLIRVEDD